MPVPSAISAFEGGLFRPFGLPYDLTGMGRRTIVPSDLLRQPPYNAICRLHGGNGGTGFLVAPDKVLTAAHNVTRARFRDLDFPSMPNIRIHQSHIEIHAEYLVPGDPFDFAILHLPVRINRNPLPIAPLTRSLLQFSRIEIAGYANEYRQMVRFREPQSAVASNQREIALRTNQFHHKLDTSTGQSGAPIMAFSQRNPRKFVAIGIHSGGRQNQTPGLLNRGTAFGHGVSLSDALTIA